MDALAIDESTSSDTFGVIFEIFPSLVESLYSCRSSDTQ